MSQGPNDPQHPISPDGNYVWDGAQWVPNVRPAYKPLPWYKKPWGVSAVVLGGFALILVASSLVAGDDEETATTDAPPTAAASSSAPEDSSKSVVDLAALDRWWAANDDDQRKDNCIGFRYNEDKWWASLLEENQDKLMPKELFTEFLASHCTKDGKPIPAEPSAEESDSASEEEPTEEPSAYENFGVFDAVKKSGSGDSVVKLGDASDAVAVAVKATHKGQSNFVIKSLDDDNDSVELLVNEIGNYSGTTLLVLDGEKRLKIDADGPWTITVSPIADMKEIDPPVDGRGDSVVLYSGGAADWMIKHKGESNFVVKQFTDDGTDLLINDIGNYSGVQPVGPGPSILTISADGSWNIAPN